MKIISKLFRLFYWPLCRVHAEHLGDKPAGTLMRFMCSIPFWMLHNYWPDFVQPTSFNEKLWSRQLHDRDPRLTLISDKLRVRHYVATKVGEKYLIPLLWEGNNPNQIPFNQLPLECVIKTNHGCGKIIVVKEKIEKIAQLQIIRQMTKWLKKVDSGQYLGIAWAYRNIEHAVIVEKFIGKNGKAPVDYKFYCFSGRVEFLTIHFNRFEEHQTLSRDRYFAPYDFRYGFDEWKGECQRPTNFEEMVKVAEILSEDFDFMRVDLYSVDDHVYFGELTPYPGGVSTKFLPLARDYILGEKWKDFKSIFNRD